MTDWNKITIYLILATAAVILPIVIGVKWWGE
jgi:hypothetical protein